MNERPSPFSLRNRAGRALWALAATLLVRSTPRPLHAWRAAVLRLFGAKLGRGCRVYPGAIIWAPWNLVCGDGACIASGAEVYNPAVITIGEGAVISQGAYLCAASHDYDAPGFPLVSKPVTIGRDAWVAARAIVLPGVTIGEGCVIGAGSVVTKDTPPRTVCAGNPCRVVRELK
jgi:putative colanic acid biosynthesis acetyltransferase WcaF